MDFADLLKLEEEMENYEDQFPVDIDSDDSFIFSGSRDYSDYSDN